jgi:histidyl-tRNA synthetase
MKVKPSLPSGTRDFLPQEVAKRKYIFDTIKKVLEKYGFQEIETPVLENLSTLTGKYGEEGDQLLFKVLNSGDFLKDVDPTILTAKDSKGITPKIAERGLRYDLTVPLARYVVQHQNDLVFPFKRYHVAPVWRADRPQKGRYREFYQFDADVIGSNSLLNEIELTQIYLEVFQMLKIDVLVSYSSRKFLEGLADYCFAKNEFTQFVTILDKNDKISQSEIIDQLNKINSNKSGDRYKELVNLFLEKLKVGNVEALQWLNSVFLEIGSEVGSQGISEIKTIGEYFSQTDNHELNEQLQFYFYLARGLNYYSGIIWEVKYLSKEGNEINYLGSLGGGGRYANLTEMFGGRDMSGVGISFGVERIYDIMKELDLFPKNITNSTRLLFVHFSEANRDFCLPYLQKLRAANIACELYPDKAKMEMSPLQESNLYQKFRKLLFYPLN